MLDKTFTPAEMEARLYAEWEARGFFKPGRKPKAEPYAGAERRGSGVARGAAARGQGAAAKAAPAAKAPAGNPPPTLQPLEAPKTQSKPAPAGGDDDWETF